MNKNLKKHRGFTLIELVIVVAIIGILALMILPQFNTVTQDARDKAWESNCQTVVSAIAMFQAGNDGEMPENADDLEPYINGGWDSLNGPSGATYVYAEDGHEAFYSKYDNYKGDSTAAGAVTGAYAGGEFSYPAEP